MKIFASVRLSLTEFIGTVCCETVAGVLLVLMYLLLQHGSAIGARFLSQVGYNLMGRMTRAEIWSILRMWWEKSVFCYLS